LLFGIASAAIGYVLSLRGSFQLHGIVIGSIALLFGVIETTFWKLAEPPSNFFSADVFDTRQAIQLEKAYRGLRPFLTRRFVISLILKFGALISSAVLLKPEVVAARSTFLLPWIERAGYFCALLALPTLVIMSRAYSQAADFRRRVELTSSTRSRSKKFEERLTSEET
jgi:hypothetical protein